LFENIGLAGVELTGNTSDYPVTRANDEKSFTGRTVVVVVGTIATLLAQPIVVGIYGMGVGFRNISVLPPPFSLDDNRFLTESLHLYAPFILM
jgi:dolichol kinase